MSRQHPITLEKLSYYVANVTRRGGIIEGSERHPKTGRRFLYVPLPPEIFKAVEQGFGHSTSLGTGEFGPYVEHGHARYIDETNVRPAIGSELSRR